MTHGRKRFGNPGLVPAATRTAGTMFAALYGDVAPHAWWGPELDQDAYSLFHSRARATQWLDETEDGAPGLWGMNDAGWQHPLARADLPLAAWFQVEVQAVAANRPLPVQPFLQCAGETVARAGTLRLDAVQVLLPIQGWVASPTPRTRSRRHS